MEFIEEIAKIKKPPSRLIDSLAEQYSAIAFKFGYLEAQSPCWLYFIKKGEGAVAFEIQFGNVSEFKSSFEKLVNSGAELCFLITSSKAKAMRLEELRGLLLRNFEIKKQKYVLLDIECGRTVLINFEWDKFKHGLISSQQRQGEEISEPKPIFRSKEKRKKIYGARGMHKVQD